MLRYLTAAKASDVEKWPRRLPTPTAKVLNVVKSHLCSALSFLNSLPNNKVLDWSKLKALADDKINVTEKLNFVLGKVENIVGKGENAGTSIFSFSYNVFKRLLIQGC